MNAHKKIILTAFIFILTLNIKSCCAVNGVPGVPGVPGLNGRDGTKGDQGSVGARGPKGPPGPKGSQGTKGDQAQAPAKNWKQCAWSNLNDGRDYGLIKVENQTLQKCSLGLLIALSNGTL